MVKLKWFRSIRQDCPGWTKPAFVWFSPRWESICPMKGISKGSRWSTKLILQEQARLESRIDLQEHKLDWNPKLILQEQARLDSQIDLQEQCSIGIRPHVWGTRMLMWSKMTPLCFPQWRPKSTVAFTICFFIIFLFCFSFFTICFFVSYIFNELFFSMVNWLFTCFFLLFLLNLPGVLFCFKISRWWSKVLLKLERETGL